LLTNIKVKRTEECEKYGLIRDQSSVFSNHFLTLSEKLLFGKTFSFETVNSEMLEVVSDKL